MSRWSTWDPDILPEPDDISALLTTLRHGCGRADVVRSGCTAFIAVCRFAPTSTCRRLRIRAGNGGALSLFSKLATVWMRDVEVLQPCVAALVALCDDEDKVVHGTNIQFAHTAGCVPLTQRLLTGPALDSAAVAEVTLELGYRFARVTEINRSMRPHVAAAFGVMARHADAVAVIRLAVQLVSDQITCDDTASVLLPHGTALVAAMQRHADDGTVVALGFNALAIAILRAQGDSPRPRKPAIPLPLDFVQSLVARHVGDEEVAFRGISLLAYLPAQLTKHADIAARAAWVKGLMTRLADNADVVGMSVMCLMALGMSDGCADVLLRYTDVVAAALTRHHDDDDVFVHSMRYLRVMVESDADPGDAAKALAAHIDGVVAVVAACDAIGDLDEEAAEHFMQYMVHLAGQPSTVSCVLRHVAVIATTMTRHADEKAVMRAGLQVVTRIAAAPGGAEALKDNGVGDLVRQAHVASGGKQSALPRCCRR